MKKKAMSKLTAFLLVVVMCMGLCADVTVNAEETDSDTLQRKEQIEQAEQIEQIEQSKQAEEADTEKEMEHQKIPGKDNNVEETDKIAEKEKVAVLENEKKGEDIKVQKLLGQADEMDKEQEIAILSSFNLNNPRIEIDSSMTAGQKVTWDCIWFGSYPQAEVVASVDNYAAIDKSMLKKGDIIEDSSLYSKLQSASGWNANNDVMVDGNKYCRIKKSDAIYTNSGSSYYNWSDSVTYHYFKYEPIKWRVLEVEENQALILSDILLDDQKYNTISEDITWETSTIRSWLNGYDAIFNKYGNDYSDKNFIGSAFSSDERLAIVTTSVVNDNNMSYGTEGGNNTSDKIFLLSESETCGESAISYGFISLNNICDEARRSKNSTYAKAMGVWYSSREAYKGNCMWWLRSPGTVPKYAATVNESGDMHYYDHVNDEFGGVRPALNLNLSSKLYTYAGTVCSNGEEKVSVSEDNNPTGNTGAAKQNQSIKTSASSYTKAIGSKSFSLGAHASGGGNLTYASSSKKVAMVSPAGQVSVKSYGTATITINASATQDYNAAAKTVTINVVPKKNSLKAVKSPSKKKVKISWKKDKSVTGYEIYVSPKKDFSRETIKRIYKKNTVSKTISGWKSKRKYYVKIRGYKKIGKTKYYGAWSNVRKVKIK